jgi:hypothetical protein
MATERELIYRVKVVADDENAKTLREHVARVRRAEDSIAALRRDSARFENESRKKLEVAQEEVNRRLGRMNETRYRDEARMMRDSLARQRQSLDTVARDAEAANKRLLASGKAVAASYSGIAESVARVGRGIATLGVLSEQSSEKLIRGLAKAQALFDLSVGGANLLAHAASGVAAVRSARGGISARRGGAAGGMIGGGLQRLAVDNAFHLGPAGAVGSTASGALAAAGEFGGSKILQRVFKNKGVSNVLSEAAGTAIGDALGEMSSEAIRKGLTKRGGSAKAAAGVAATMAEMLNAMPTMSRGGFSRATVAGAERTMLLSRTSRTLAGELATGAGGHYLGQAGGNAVSRFGMTQGVASRMAGAGIAGSVGGGAASSAGGGFLAGAGSLGGLGAFTAFAASMALMGKVIHETATGTQNDAKSWSNTIAKFELQAGKAVAGVFGEKNLKQVEKWAKVGDLLTGGLPIISNIVGGGAQMARSEAALAKLEQSSARTGGQRLRSEAMRSAALTGSFDLRGVEEDRLTRLSGQATTPRSQLAAILAEAEQNKGAIAVSRKGMASESSEGGRAALQGEYARLLERSAEISERRLTAERQLIAEQRGSIQERITGAEKELELTRARVQAARDSLKSSAERFADLSGRDKARAIQAIQQARTRGAASLNREQRGLLRTVGGRDAEAAASDSAMSDARRSGFFSFFGGSEGRDIAGGGAAEKKLAMQLTDDRKLVVQIDRDDDRIAAVATQAINKALAERDRVLIEKIQQAQEQATRAAAQTADAVFQAMWQQNQARGTSMPGR